MKNIPGLVLFLLILCSSQLILAQTPTASASPASSPVTDIPVLPSALDKWRDARFGMFIHWGPVSLSEKEISWSRGGKGTPIEEYDALYKKFDPERFNADEWVATAKAAGMKYIVLTCKHHDGFCLWDTKQTAYNIMHTPFKRDVVKELAHACKKQGMPFGTYYSTCDWHHPDFPLTSPGGKTVRETSNLDRYTDYLKAQISELLKNYGPLFTLWFDVPQKFDKERGQSVINLARTIQPDIVINSRTGAAGDYDNPEQKIGGFKMDHPWETCMTICQQWSWKPDDTMKSLKECLQTLLRTVGGDGNLLFNVGPQPDGLIEARQVDRLKEIGNWLSSYGESVYGTRGGPYKPTKNFVTTRNGNAIFLHILSWPENVETIALPPLPAKIIGSEVLTGGTDKVKQWSGGITICIPKADHREIDTLVRLDLDSSAMEIAPITPEGAIVDNSVKASASSLLESNLIFAASKAIDGDSATYWSAEKGAKQASLTLDFGQKRKVHTVEIMEYGGNRITKFIIEKQVGEEWKPVFGGTTLGPHFKQTFPEIATQKVRLNILDASETPAISEISFR